MKALIVYASPHHGNTRKVAEAMARPLQADLVDVTKEPLPEFSAYDFVGFASGIYFQKFHKRVEECLKAAAFSKEQRVFLVATCGVPLGNYTRKLEKKLEQKGVPVAGVFQCRGYDTYGIFGKVGGIAKGHPNAKDLARAEQFAEKLMGQAVKK